jgi:hypothetical protein
MCRTYDARAWNSMVPCPYGLGYRVTQLRRSREERTTRVASLGKTGQQLYILCLPRCSSSFGVTSSERSGSCVFDRGMAQSRKRKQRCHTPQMPPKESSEV